MERYKIPLVNGSGETTGFADRWWAHRVRDGPEGPVLGKRHVGITIACLGDDGRVLIQHRKHKIFDKVWSLSGDTHPRKYEGRRVETLSESAQRCAKEDWGISIKDWTQRFTVAYSARDPRDPKYCENELLYVLFAKHRGPMRMNEQNAYESKWVQAKDIAADSRTDLKKKPIDRRFAPWVDAIFALPPRQVREGFAINGL